MLCPENNAWNLLACSSKHYSKRGQQTFDFSIVLHAFYKV